MNILIKLMSIVSLVIAPTLATLHKDKIEHNRAEKLKSLQLKSVATNDVLVATAVADDVADMIATAKPIVEGSLNKDGDFVYETGEIGHIKLKDGKQLDLGKNSQILMLYNGVLNKTPEVLNKEKWFTIENLYFESGKETLKPSSTQQLENLALIMNEFPDLQIKLGGYTDNTGSEEGNIKLSNERAKTAKAKLESLGIQSNRIEAEGYGSQYPVCPENDTPECKAKNRRIDVRVLKM
jgi:K(+)-stimulated pyrophosphate-energized sodium pump